MAKHSVLFVCLGNICRSPLAEAAFRAAAEDLGLDVHTDSAGTADYHVDQPPDPRCIATARDRGMDISHYRGRQIVEADYILDLLEGREGEAVPDPYYGGPDGFESVWNDVFEAAKALAQRLK